MDHWDKEALRRDIIRRLERERASLEGAALEARGEATDVESRQEGKFDMRAQTAAYLAAGQSRRAAEIGGAIAAWANLALAAGPGGPATLGSLVGLDLPGGRVWYLLGPASGGLELQAAGTAVTVITPFSPLGGSLVGRRPGERVRLPGPRGAEALVAALA